MSHEYHNQFMAEFGGRVSEMRFMSDLGRQMPGDK